MKLTEALRGVRLLGFDTAPLIYFIEHHPEYFDRMHHVLQAVDNGSMRGVTSTIALTEVLVHPLRMEHHDLAARYEALLTHSHGFRLEPVTAPIAHRAADLRARYDLRTPDALHVATAIEAGCDAFLSNDTGITRVTDLTVLILDELESDPSTSS